MKMKKRLLFTMLVASAVMLTACQAKLKDDVASQIPVQSAAEESGINLGSASRKKNGENELLVAGDLSWEAERDRAAELEMENGDKAPKDKFDREEEDEIIVLVNQARADNGLAALTKDELMVGAAEIRAQEQKELYSHTRPPKDRYFDSVFDDCEIDFCYCGENLATGTPCSAKEIVDAWLNSPHHRANILDPEFTRIGVGCYLSDGYSYWAQLFAD